MAEAEPAVQAFERTLAEVCEREGWELETGRVRVELGEGRRQEVVYDALDFEGERLVRLYTTIGDATRIRSARLTQGLRINFGLPHGALALHRDDLVLVDTVGDASPPAALASAIRYLAATADHFERTMFGPDQH